MLTLDESQELIKDKQKQPNNEYKLRIVLPRKEGTTELTRLDQTNAMKILASYGGLRSVICNGITFTSNRKIKLIIDGDHAVPKSRYSRRRAIIKNSQFKNCKFDCHFTNFMNHHTAGRTAGGAIENCDFTRAVFTGTLKRVMFKDCDFRGADLSKAVLKSVQFTNCNFRGTKLPYPLENGNDYRNSLGNHNRNPFNWDKRNLERIKYDKNAKGMNPDRVARNAFRKNSKKRIRQAR